MVTVFDLDDTLYDEIDFVKSGFSAVAETLGEDAPIYREWMWKTFMREGSGTVFNRLIDTFGLPLTVDRLVALYRNHAPKITLGKESIELLQAAKHLGPTAMITDGAAHTQKAKFDALHLGPWIDFPIFTALYGTQKPEALPFEMVMNHFPLENKFVYISDNPNKDFFAPNDLGWLTIRYKNPRGVYRDAISNAFFEINSLLSAITILETYEKEN